MRYERKVYADSQETAVQNVKDMARYDWGYVEARLVSVSSTRSGAEPHRQPGVFTVTLEVTRK